jgi:tRNA(Ile)-lysidine synthase
VVLARDASSPTFSIRSGHRMTLIDRVRRTLKRHNLATPTTRVCVALSGGPDSMALLHALCALRAEGVLQLAGVAHLNHQLRDAADADAHFCEGVANSLGLPFSHERIDVNALVRAEHRSVEDAAHRARHAFFERVLAGQHADVMAVGHTRDDQAETFLLRLVRGAGTRGLAAMHPRNGSVIRPLLDCSREDVRAFLQQQGLASVHDISNDDVGIPRNRVRGELLPLLRERFNPRIVEALAAEAGLARADQEFLQRQADEWTGAHVRSDTQSVWRVDADALRGLPRAIGSRVLHELMMRAGSTRSIGFDAVERAWSVVEGLAGGLDAAGHRLERVGPDVVLSSRPAGSAGRRPAVSAHQVSEFSRPLPIPGEVAIPEIGCVMSAEVGFSAENVPSPNGTVAVVPKDKVAGGLAVRNRRAGDRLMPSTAGHRKLQDLLVDRKVPRADRDRLPIVVDAHDRIVWVAGVVVDMDFRVTDSAQAVVILRLKGVGGSC